MLILGRFPQLLAGLVVFGAGLGVVVTAGNGMGPWTVFHEGAALRTPLSIGGVIIVTGVCWWPGWWPSRSRSAWGRW